MGQRQFPQYIFYSINRTWELWGSFFVLFVCLLLLGAIIYFTPYYARLCTRFFTSVSFTTTLQGSIIIMFTLKTGELSPSSIKEFAEGQTGRKRLSWDTNLGQWDLNLSSFHNSVFYCRSWWGRGKRCPVQTSPPPSAQISLPCLARCLAPVSLMAAVVRLCQHQRLDWVAWQSQL